MRMRDLNWMIKNVVELIYDDAQLGSLLKKSLNCSFEMGEFYDV